ncbi:hypothetical protein KA107_03545 [Candidatus Pacearchaeota archaeon]|nr:hypothetical protein [Candidatus Pacearchaeota archaeon]
MPQYTPARGAMGCANIVTILGGFGCGVYAGFKQATGVELGSLAHYLLLYAPTGLAAVLGHAMGKDLGQDSSAMRELAQNQLDRIHPIIRSQVDPEALARYNASNSSRGIAMTSTIVTGVATAAGYWLGKKLASN